MAWTRDFGSGSLVGEGIFFECTDGDGLQNAVFPDSMCTVLQRSLFSLEDLVRAIDRTAAGRFLRTVLPENWPLGSTQMLFSF